jgi:polyferredoxin
METTTRQRRQDIVQVKIYKNWWRNGHKLRKLIQYGFLATCAVLGIQFYFWYRQFESGGVEIPRPAGVEGFLPLSALISLKYWLTTGIFNQVHPAALVILLAILAISLIFKKSFCSFICPVGLISEWLWKLGRKLFGRRFIAPFGWRPPKWIDYPLRAIKYLLLAFFVNAILISMDSGALGAFINSPYNKIADIKMLLFFAKMSSFAFGVILLLAVASLFISNFWCRYLCPYGALLGAVSFLSPVKICRNKATCTNCLACTRVCPAMIKVHKAGRVRSDECTNCMECVKACPVRDTLYPEVIRIKKKVTPRAIALSVLGIFLAFYIGAMISGYWSNNITADEYKYHIEHMDGLEYNHFE